MESPSVSETSMLKTCSAPGCTTIVLGQGTCTEHDRPVSATPVLDRRVAVRESAAFQERRNAA
jgi:hypothetical protein